MELKRALRELEIPHRWLRPDSVRLEQWRITTPDLCRGFGWSSVDADGAITEAWAELNVDTFSSDREFEVSVNGDRRTTADQRLHFRCERAPRVRLFDYASGSRGTDHLQLVGHDGPIASVHRIAAVC